MMIDGGEDGLLFSILLLPFLSTVYLMFRVCQPRIFQLGHAVSKYVSRLGNGVSKFVSKLVSKLKMPCERDWREREEFFSRKISVHFSAAFEKLVFPHRDLRINFLYQIQNDGNDNQKRGPADCKIARVGKRLHEER